MEGWNGGKLGQNLLLWVDRVGTKFTVLNSEVGPEAGDGGIRMAAWNKVYSFDRIVRLCRGGEAYSLRRTYR
jgi:hypothetical protein